MSLNVCSVSVTVHGCMCVCAWAYACLNYVCRCCFAVVVYVVVFRLQKCCLWAAFVLFRLLLRWIFVLWVVVISANSANILFTLNVVVKFYFFGKICVKFRNFLVFCWKSFDFCCFCAYDFTLCLVNVIFRVRRFNVKSAKTLYVFFYSHVSSYNKMNLHNFNKKL